MHPLELIVGWTAACEHVSFGEVGDRSADTVRGVGPAQRGVGRLETLLAGPCDLRVGRPFAGRPEPAVPIWHRVEPPAGVPGGERLRRRPGSPSGAGSSLPWPFPNVSGSAAAMAPSAASGSSNNAQVTPAGTTQPS